MLWWTRHPSSDVFPSRPENHSEVDLVAGTIMPKAAYKTAGNRKFRQRRWSAGVGFMEYVGHLPPPFAIATLKEPKIDSSNTNRCSDKGGYL
jgi:hypothetical protein